MFACLLACSLLWFGTVCLELYLSPPLWRFGSLFVALIVYLIGRFLKPKRSLHWNYCGELNMWLSCQGQ